MCFSKDNIIGIFIQKKKKNYINWDPQISLHGLQHLFAQKKKKRIATFICISTYHL